MTCEQVRLAIPGYCSGELEKSEYQELSQHVLTCVMCQAELSEMTALWTSLGQIPLYEPSPMMRTRFEDMLSAYEQGMQRGRQESPWHRVKDYLHGFWPAQPAWQLAIAVACLVFGFLGGKLANRGPSPVAQTELSSLRGEVASMRQLVTLSLLQQQSPSDRLKGVNWSVRVEQPTPEVPAALLYAVAHDENTNVRLAAVDALHSFTSDERTRRALLTALPKQDSPLVQIAIINLLSQLHEPDTAKTLRRMAIDSRVDQSVRQYAETTAGKMRFE